MSIATVQIRLLGEGEAVEAARMALLAVASPALSISIARSSMRSGHFACTTYGTVMVDTAALARMEDRVTLSLTPRQADLLHALIHHTLQHVDNIPAEIEHIHWLLTINKQGITHEGYYPDGIDEG